MDFFNLSWSSTVFCLIHTGSISPVSFYVALIVIKAFIFHLRQTVPTGDYEDSNGMQTNTGLSDKVSFPFIDFFIICIKCKISMLRRQKAAL